MDIGSLAPAVERTLVPHASLASLLRWEGSWLNCWFSLPMEVEDGPKTFLSSEKNGNP